MAGTASTGKAALAVEEARLARAAAAGDGNAFATLYERYARRAYNLAYRLTGSEQDAADAVQDAFLNVMRRLPQLDDRELAFGSYLFTAARNASYDLISRQRRAQPSDSIPESAVPVGAGAGGLGLDPGDPEEDPDRKQMLASQQEEIREANGRLPERQREALALRELEDLSYDEIAEAMDMNRNSVAQLISRARINLRDELRGTALASVAASSPECERALPLIAMRDDGQLDDADDAAWLDDHLSDCDRCRVATGAMQEAGASYRAWVPIAVAPWLFKATMSRAAELSGADWSEVIAERSARQADLGSLPGMPPAYRVARKGGGRKLRRRAAFVVALAALLLAGGIAAVLAGGGDGPAPAPSRPAAAGHPARSGKASRHGTKRHAKHRQKRSGRSEPAPDRPQQVTPASGATTTGASAPTSQGQAGSQGQTGSKGGSSEPASHPSGGSGTAGLNTTRAPTDHHPPASAPAPEPTPAPAPTPTPEGPPATTEPPPSEEPPEEPPPEEPPPAGVPPGPGVP